jgi:hypothetical protein
MQQIDNSSRTPIISSCKSLSLREQQVLRQAAQEIRQNIDTTIRAIWTIGRKLVEVRWQLEENLFGEWLHREFEWSRRTAYHYINVYEAFPQIDTENFTRLDIDVSALYLLAAPSTPSELRSHFFKLAQSGKRVRHKDVKASLQQVKVLSIVTDTGSTLEVQLASPKHILELPEDDEDLETGTAIAQSVSAIHPAWNLVNEHLSLYWGDISAPRFNEYLPDEAFVLATPSNTLQQAWLANNTRSSIAIDKSQLDKKMVAGFLEVIAERQKAIVFPWLPKVQIVKIALELQLDVYAADANLHHCERLLSQLGFDLQQIQRIWV